MPLTPEFERALLLLDLDSPQREAIEVAARFAELLNLNLVGLFALDDALRRLAAYPGARELVSAGGTWRPLEIDRMVREEMLAAQAASRVFGELTSPVGVRSAFEIVGGRPMQTCLSASRALDILVVAEPTRASASATRAFSQLFEAAMRSPASVLLVPRFVRRRAGPIVAIARAPDDPGIAVASVIAAASHEELIKIEVDQRARLGVGTLLGSTLANANESLIVVTREGVDAPEEIGRAIAEKRRVPVLILEPVQRSET